MIQRSRAHTRVRPYDVKDNDIKSYRSAHASDRAIEVRSFLYDFIKVRSILSR